jgi:hypothetical protein
LRNALAPEPNTTYGSVLPLARDDKTGEIRLAMPGIIRAPLQGAIDLLQGPGGMQINPHTGTMTLTPEATSTLAMIGGRPLQFSRTNPLAPEPLGTFDRRANLPPEFKEAPYASERAGTGTEAGPSTPAATPPPGVSAPPTTADEAKAIASNLYKRAETAGGTLTPQFTNKFIDSLAEAGPKTELGATVPGSQVAKQITTDLQNFRDKPLTLEAVQEFDERIGKLINADYKANRGLSDTGQELLDIQQKLRSQIENAAEGNIAGGTAGFKSLSDARKAYSQAMKMRDLENVRYRADATDNPATSYKNQLNTILNNAKSRGYTDEERAAVENARDRGVLGGTLHVFGSRLIPIIAGATEAGTGGITRGLAAAGVTHTVGTALRAAAATLQRNKLGKALTVMGESVPTNPLTPPWLAP